MKSLEGRTVIVTRASDRGSELADRLRDLGADVLEIPLTTTADPEDGGQSLERAMRRLADHEWLVVTSPEGARRVRDAATRVGVDVATGRGRTRIAAVGEASAAPLGGADLVATGSTGASLGDDFPPGSGRVLLAVAAGARTDFEDRARAKGWTVDRVVAYRTVAVDVAPAVYGDVAHADAIAFASSSAVESWCATFGNLVPGLVVAIGPSTTDTATRLGLVGVRTAREHSIAGLAAAVAESLPRSHP